MQVTGSSTIRRFTTVSVLAAMTATLSACEGDGGAQSAGGQESNTPPAVNVSFSVPNNSAKVAPDAALKATVQNGDIVQASLTGPGNKQVPGTVTGNAWAVAPDVRLTPNAAYRWQVTARSQDGAVTTQTAAFRTIKPKVTATYTVTPDGSTVGVGMPVVVRFDSAVGSRAMRAEVEKRMKITTTPAQKGSWGWLDEQSLMWRPDVYWKPNTTVKVSAPLAGVQTGTDKWVGENKGATFKIAKRARITKVDLAGHEMTVRDNGKLVHTYPISAGKPIGRWETRSGIKVITEKHSSYVMDAGTLGLESEDPNYYRKAVRYAMRVTDTGEFFHSAPWTVNAQGHRNVSHGCVNMAPGDAREFFKESLVGDVAEFVGSKRKMKETDGMTAWVFTPKQWRSRSAL